MKHSLQIVVLFVLVGMLQACAPVISGFRSPSTRCELRGSHINIVGTGFGQPAPGLIRPADRRLAAGGHGVHVDLEVVWWSDTEIEAVVPRRDPRLRGGQWYYVGIEKADHSEWLSNINKTFLPCPVGNPLK